MTLTASFGAGCGGTLEVVRSMTPADARESGLEPVAIVRATDKVPIPRGARIEDSRVVLPHTTPVDGGDVIEEDEIGRIVAVRRASGERVTFEPGTASMSPSASAVTGERTGRKTGTIALMPHDRIEVRGHFAADDAVPGGGRVEARRPMGLVVGGATVLALGYAPAAYVGAVSPRSTDRVLMIPIAGPFLALSTRSHCAPPPGAEMLPVDACIEEKVTRAALVAGGAVQSLGAVLLALGLPTRMHVIPTSEGRDSKRSKKKASASVLFLPTPGGAAAFGTF